MLEQYAFYVLIAGLVLAIIGYVWLIVAAFRVRLPAGQNRRVSAMISLRVAIVAKWRYDAGFNAPRKRKKMTCLLTKIRQIWRGISRP